MENFVVCGLFSPKQQRPKDLEGKIPRGKASPIRLIGPADASAYFQPPAKTELCLCDGVDPLALAREARLRSLENRSGNKTARRTNDVSKTSQIVRRFPTNPDVAVLEWIEDTNVKLPKIRF